MKNYHFISGLPRSGSLVLNSILNQNPRFQSSIPNPLSNFIKKIIIESNSQPDYLSQCPESKQVQLIRNLVNTYHSDSAAEVCFNTNFEWSSLLPILDVTHPDSKIICCVRDIPNILNSFEKLFKQNPFACSSLFNEETIETVYTRSTSLMMPGSVLRNAYDSLKEIITGPQKHKVMILEFQYLCSSPEKIMRSLYNFIGEPYYEHDFSNLKFTHTGHTNIKNLYNVRPILESCATEFIIPPDIINQFSNLEVWR